MGLPEAIATATRLRDCLADEVERSRKERAHLKALDSEALLAGAEIRAEFNTAAANLQRDLATKLGAVAAERGLNELSLEALAGFAPIEAAALSRTFAEIRSLASALSEARSAQSRGRCPRPRLCGELRACAVERPAGVRPARAQPLRTPGPGHPVGEGLMGDLLAILSQGASSLGAHRAASATASHNLQNADTPGYARQRANLEANLPAQYVGNAFLGRGVALGTISQARDRFLEAQMPGALASAAQSSAEAQALSSVNALDPEAAGGLGESLSHFFSSIRALSQNAGDAGLRRAAVDSARSLAQSFARTAGALDSARDGLDSEAAGLVTEVNVLARQMADLNQQVRAARATGAEPNDLLDARLRLQDALAEKTGAVPVPDAQGNVSMVLPSGVALVHGDGAATLATTPDAANRGHLAITATLSDGTGPVAASSFGGTLGGLLAARDGAIADAETAVDTLAFDLAGAVNTVHAAGTALDGSTGRDLFVVGATPVDAASQLAVDAAIAADPSLFAAAQGGGPGDGSNALALVAVETQSLSAGQSAAGALSRLTADFGAAAQRATAMSEQDAAIQDHLSSLRESVSGVSIDEELVEMTKAQRAYEAVTKVITAADEMLQTLMNLK
ncbi:MAG: flagellar hook-associated protein FlgK [Myxococcales bacterium]